MISCDWCGEPILNGEVPQPQRLASNRSPVTANAIGFDLNLVVVQKEAPAHLHENCHEDLAVGFFLKIVGKVAKV